MSSSPQEKKLVDESVFEQASEDGSTSKLASLDPVELQILERKAVRRLDVVILPMISMFYLLSFLDRANIGNARVAGLQKNLGMTDHQYQICITVLYVPYILAELPANLLLRKIGPRYLMPSLLTAWGTMVALQGLVSSFAGLATVRAFLGLVEGPMFPGWLFSSQRLRHVLFFDFHDGVDLIVLQLSGAFSGLLAAAIVKMDGLGGRPGWAYIFIEGAFSVLMGILGFFIIPSTPQEVKFMSLEMKELLARRLARDNPTLRNNQDDFSFREVARSLKSPHVLLLFAVFYGIGTVLYGQALFLPSIVNQLGFSPNKTQLLSVGPFAGGFFVTLLGAIWSDRMESRAIPSMVISLLGVIGFSIYLTTTGKFTRYGSLFFTVPGVYAAVPPLSAWMSNNSEPHYRRATSIALGFVGTNCGGIMSTWLFPTKDAPNYRRTTIINLSFSIMILVGSGINAVLLHFKNKEKIKKRDEILAPYHLELDDDKGTNAARAWVELGDRHPDFKYTL
ncbi:hypothetical protein D9757_001855 [Collybiopsis confluens]|uniref:Major facilitator superfamily (MFS) profile domain-containing protein n=1 Tax=Collybiopsis confluens TaxID=2823264 RepID=A0A8H5HXD6_9AGAR|nr:hypothetical protein D9757_001855 [Collybiopsis confluens]